MKNMNTRDASHIIFNAIKEKGWETFTISVNTMVYHLHRKDKNGKEEVKDFQSKEEFNKYLGLI